MAALSACIWLATGCGGDAGGAGGDWYYHFDCHGDPECLGLNPLPAGTPSGTLNEGPREGDCRQLQQFSSRFWNMPPATDSCDHSPSPPAGPPSIAGFTPDSGAPGTPITITGASFPVGGAGLTVLIGGLPATVTGATTTRLVVLVPALGNTTSFITVTTPAGTAVSTVPFTVVVPNPLGTATIKAIARGVDHACAVLADGTARCWGGNASGQLGDGTTTASTPAVAVRGIANAIDVAAGDAFSCAVVEAVAGDGMGAVRCWGKGTSGQLGDGASASAPAPVAVAGVTSATQLSARGAHACALLARNGGIVCWGDGAQGQLGQGALAGSPTPVAVQRIGADDYAIVDAQGEPASVRAFQVSAGVAHTCARVSTSAGSAGLGVRCWGATNLGELGNGAPLCQAGVICDPKAPNPVPQRVTGVSSAAHLAAGGHHTCVALVSGVVRCWGAGDQGQLGNGGSTRSSTPVGVAGIIGASHASAGTAFSCASVGGALRCWGANGSGQLGNSTRADAATPVAATAVAAGSYDPQTLAGGDQATCLRRTDGTGYCFP
jgi:alpha-tubulin suppressor-like RCC1 family protein